MDNTVDIRVESPLAAEQVRKYFNDKCRVIIEDLQQYVDDFDKEQAIASNKSGADFFDSYHTLEENEEWWRALVNANSDIATLNPSIGKSFEGRDIYAIRVSSSGE